MVLLRVVSHVVDRKETLWRLLLLIICQCFEKESRKKFVRVQLRAKTSWQIRCEQSDVKLQRVNLKAELVCAVVQLPDEQAALTSALVLNVLVEKLVKSARLS